MSKKQKYQKYQKYNFRLNLDFRRFDMINLNFSILLVDLYSLEFKNYRTKFEFGFNFNLAIDRKSKNLEL